MESIIKNRITGLTWSKFMEVTGLLVIAYLFCRCQIPEGEFIAAISFMGYMVLRNIKNIYLLIPLMAALLPYLNKGYDVWVYIIVAMISTITFVAVKSVNLHLWQGAVMTIGIFVATMNVYRLITKTVYKIEIGEFVKEGLIIFGLFYVLELMLDIIGKKESRLEVDGGVREAALLVASLLVMDGMGLSILGWALVMVTALYALDLKDVGHALVLITAGGIVLALMGEEQWGSMMTCIVAITGASLVKPLGTGLSTLTFLAVGMGLGYVESGVVLGIDKYYIILSSLAYIITCRKLRKYIKKFVFRETSLDEDGDDGLVKEMKNAIGEKTSQMKILSELYSTYMDRRVALANQFDITRQIIEDVQCKVEDCGERGRSKGRSGLAKKPLEKFELDISISQCAATGEINGDCCGWQDIGGGLTAMVISDGMGKGTKAASESLMVTKTMLALLRAGAEPETVLKMINTIMLMKEDDDFYATLDMVIINKISGKTKFYKIGAAPTLIRRGDRVEEVKLSTLPLGIVNGLSIKYMEAELGSGDWIIMMSDGVSDGGDDNYRNYGSEGRSFLKTIENAVSSVRSEDATTMGRIIINKAADSYIGRERDDLTVMVCKIIG